MVGTAIRTYISGFYKKLMALCNIRYMQTYKLETKIIIIVGVRDKYKNIKIKNWRKIQSMGWKSINWAEIEYFVYDLQRNIYDLRTRDELKEMRIIQRYLTDSWEAKLLAVRKVTQDNRGKKTAGVDGIVITKIEERINLTRKLIFDGNADIIRRVNIPKSNGKTRPLGIPTIKDRAKQMLMKLALEPEWESQFEPNSYGFRPGYSTADCKWAITRQIQGAPKYFLDADIEGCFDNIKHEHLLKKLNTTKMYTEQIRSWLKAGILDYTSTEKVIINESGTPQGGIISPLLSNVALHGMEYLLLKNFSRNGVKVIRYADDFVVMSHTLNDVIKSKNLIEEFLEPIGLKLSKEKTRIGHSMEVKEGTQGPIGLDFLGFHFRNHSTSKHRGVKNTKGMSMKFRQRTTPSRDAIQNHKKVIINILQKHKTAPLISVIRALSLRIQGWTRYFCITQCTKSFTSLDGWLWNKLWRWAIKRYKSAGNAKRKCFNVKGWKFGTISEGKTFMLNRHDQTNVRKYIKIKSGASIFSGELMYFAKRLSYHNSRINRLHKLLKSQGFKCAYCLTLLRPDDIIELHHELSTDGVRNNVVKFIHGHCHDSVHR